MNRTFKSLLCMSCCAGGLLAAPSVFAAEAGTAAANAPAVEVGDVIVTAQKRSESVQKVPASIAVLGSEALAQRGITSAQDIQFAVPSFHMGVRSPPPNINIRGVGANVDIGGPAVAVSIDGVQRQRLAHQCGLLEFLQHRCDRPDRDC